MQKIFVGSKDTWVLGTLIAKGVNLILEEIRLATEIRRMDDAERSIDGVPITCEHRSYLIDQVRKRIGEVAYERWVKEGHWG